ncbi:MAG: WbqC family protein [Candidatus Omnitrophica bacterium]|nr:WbqC family protein [Candidatus Omnitrophota bacterium]
MVVAVHQPNYLPWLGFFHKIDKCDTFVFLDNVQYEKREFQNRNKIRTKEDFHWLTVPVITKGLYTQTIREVLVDNTQEWQKTHWGLISTNYGNSPYFSEHRKFFSEVYAQTWVRLVDLNVSCINYILDYLGIKKPVCFESSIGIQSFHTQRIIDICRKLNADTYLSGLGAKEYLEEDKFKEASIKLAYQDFVHPEYKQVYSPFIPQMSIIDLIFNCGKEGINILRGQK